MEAPKCKICGCRHYGLCAAPVCQTEQPVPVEDGADDGIVPPVQEVPVPISVHGPVSASTDRPKRDRSAYMRDYMRARREAQRNGDPVPTSTPKPPFDRTAYQREYMRRLRAMQKPSPS